MGLLAGAGVLTRTMCGELCDKSNRIKGGNVSAGSVLTLGFAIFSPAFTIGITFGHVDL